MPIENVSFLIMIYSILTFQNRDLRARLEMAVDHIMAACSEVECITDTDCTTIVTESDGQPGNK